MFFTLFRNRWYTSICFFKLKMQFLRQLEQILFNKRVNRTFVIIVIWKQSKTFILILLENNQNNLDDFWVSFANKFKHTNKKKSIYSRALINNVIIGFKKVVIPKNLFRKKLIQVTFHSGMYIDSKNCDRIL